ncbi:MAG TPA: cobaltochelatase subunit CobN [Oscillatoriaceae cyanobacterium M33_DOE_052]|uniref:Cobaltochelatase subunit CobN n=1 Tax=Planktothricoides sp. SpSt-374 TaxID=2282167 RepID=A0A7C3VGN3_9CYAN|nr:cobaltochelatase subunit CobN [Oscillatoriaceae cyanobacterium M33_DOE_052]
MHRLAATPGGWNPDTLGTIFLEQTPAPIVFLSAADTDIQIVAAAAAQLPADFPPLRVANLLQLQQQLTIDVYAQDVLSGAQVIVLRLLGGRAYWSYGLEVVRETVANSSAMLLVIPGDDAVDPDLIAHSTVSLTVANQLWRYFTEGGRENIINALQFVAATCLGQNYHPSPPVPVPKTGLYSLPPNPVSVKLSPKVGIIFYRAHYLAGNLAPIDALCEALRRIGLEPVPAFVSSLRDVSSAQEITSYFHNQVDLVICTTGFAIAQDGDAPSLWQDLDVPVLQVIFSGGTQEQWQSGFNGLSPRDIAMNVALPELDGRIITRAVSFKTVQEDNQDLETQVVTYQPERSRIDFVAQLAANWIKLRRTPPQQRRIALILANYPTRNGRLANGVGLDTPASCIEILKSLQAAGYEVENIPASGEELINRLTALVTNDPEGRDYRKAQQYLPAEEYWQYFTTLPPLVQEQIHQRWSKFVDNSAPVFGLKPNYEPLTKDKLGFPIPGIQLGNVFIGIQPARGYDLDPSLNYHAPDLEPPHDYLAYYYWLRNHFGALAVVHVGKHGNLEWLPGKGVALSECCYPEIALGALPHLYPFIVNDPGEGSQAKRRAQAVIIDHLTPPLTRAELYGPLLDLERLIDEYWEARSLDPSRLSVIQERIAKLMQEQHLQPDLPGDVGGDGSSPLPTGDNFEGLLNDIDGYLCELKEAQIRDGLHVFGQVPQGRQLRDLMVSIARAPGPERLGLTRAIARDWGWEFDPLTEKHKSPDGVEKLELFAAELGEKLITDSHIPPDSSLFMGMDMPATAKELTWMQQFLLPALRETHQEITNLLRGLDGCYVSSGPSGAPTRGRPEVLPTGRNFYSTDIRALPTETAWEIGRKAAEEVICRYTQEQGEYPQTLGLSVWGTATMRTGGDDIAQALALLGVRPVWDGPSRRVVDFEIIPVQVLGRPRVDCTLRISGFFRDAFPNLIDLFDQAVVAVANLDEPPEDNPLAAKVRRETQWWVEQGLEEETAVARSSYRIFGSKPGAYGAGLQGLIAAQNWENEQDLARAYINWSSYAYSSHHQGGLAGIPAPEAFSQRLGDMQIVLHNQDNREHDLLDSDDYYQFQGGLTAAVRSVRGQHPLTYFGDNSLPEQPKVRQLREEIARVYRSRVINPKWIAGVMRHGYKGAFEMAATVDYLFAYDATAHCVEDYMYAGVAAAYIFDPTVRQFIETQNPWALRDMAERLLEANARGLWAQVPEEMLAKLRHVVLAAEAVVEMR